MKNLPTKVSTNHELSNIANGSARPVSVHSKRVSQHVSAVQMLVAESVKKKAEYAPDIAVLRDHGLNIKSIANILGMSESYCNKLLHQASQG